MIAGTFREWVDNGTPGVFTVRDATGCTTSFQLAEYQRGVITYDVVFGYQTDDELVARQYNFDNLEEPAAVFLGSWETPGEVIDG